MQPLKNTCLTQAFSTFLSHSLLAAAIPPAAWQPSPLPSELHYHIQFRYQSFQPMLLVQMVLNLKYARGDSCNSEWKRDKLFNLWCWGELHYLIGKKASFLSPMTLNMNPRHIWEVNVDFMQLCTNHIFFHIFLIIYFAVIKWIKRIKCSKATPLKAATQYMLNLWVGENFLWLRLMKESIKEKINNSEDSINKNTNSKLRNTGNKYDGQRAGLATNKRSNNNNKSVLCLDS